MCERFNSFRSSLVKVIGSVTAKIVDQFRVDQIRLYYHLSSILPGFSAAGSQESKHRCPDFPLHTQFL